MDEKNKKSGIFFCILSNVVFAAFVFYWKALKNVPQYEILAMRIIFTAITGFIILAITKKLAYAKECLREPKRMMFIAFAGLFIATNWGCYIWGVANGFILECALAQLMTPFMVAVIGVLFFRERPSGFTAASFAIAAFGVIYMVINYGHFPFVAITMATTGGAYAAMKKKAKAQPLAGVCLEALTTSPLAIAYLIYVSATGGLAMTAESTGIKVLVLLVGAVSLLPLVLMMASQARLDLVIYGIVSYIGPILQTMIGVFIYKEAFTVTHVVTFSCIFAALAVFTIGQLRDKKNAQKAQPTYDIAKGLDTESAMESARAK